MYENCATCTKPGKSCYGPRLEKIPGNEAIALCKARKVFLGLSNQRIADMANMSKGTIDGLFSSAHADFRHETMRPVWNVLFGGEMPEDTCDSITDGERAAYEEKIRKLEHDLEWRDDKIKQLQETNASMQMLITNSNKRNTADKDFLRSQVKSKNKVIVVLALLLSLSLLLIFSALIIDRINPDIGFFWISKLFPSGARFVKEIGNLPFIRMC